MRFKELKLNKEYTDLGLKNPGLRMLIDMLEKFCLMEFNKDVCITHIFRTPEQHAALYAATDPAKRPASSPHMRWEAVDIRSSDFTTEQVQRMLQFLNAFRYSGKLVALYHKVSGNAYHFHVQYGKSVS